jgi:hypothetical protein
VLTHACRYWHRDRGGCPHWNGRYRACDSGALLLLLLLLLVVLGLHRWHDY